MPNLHRLYQAGAATIVHAAATPYRERSHFDGQDVLESGLGKPGAADTGWLNRALAARCSRAGAPARAGAAPSPSDRSRRWWCAVRRRCCPGRRRGCRRPATTRMMRLLDLYRHTDPALARVLEERLGLAAIARAGGMDGRAAARGRGGTRRCAPISPKSAGTAAKFLARPDGPRIGALAFDGWDTHANEGAIERAARQAARRARRRHRGGRDRRWARPGARPSSPSSPSSAAPRASTAPRAPTTAPPRWRCSPAARSRAAASIADWPGLKPANLHEGRDLKPTTDLRAVLKGLLKDHLRVDEARSPRRCSRTAPP